jgi:serine protease inhibitor
LKVESALLADDSYLTKGLEIEDRARTLVKIPKFRIESSHDLKPILQNLGLGNIFSPDSDLSGISGRPDLAVDEVNADIVVVIF